MPRSHGSWAGRTGRGATGRSAWRAASSGVTTFATLITSLAAVAALLFTGLSLQQAADQNRLAASGQITDRFNAAVANLGSDTETIRVGGIFALERIMQDSPRDQPAVIQVLAAFVREQAPRKDPPTSRAAALRGPAIDVQTALSVLDTRNLAADDGASIDLDDTDLANANLDDASLRGMTLNYADLSGADLFSADLTDATFLEANLSNAEMGDTNLSGVRLTGANLAGADLNHAKLAAADLNSADLRGADLFAANLDRVVLIDANLSGARLDGTSWCLGDKPNFSGGYVCTPTATG